VDNAFLPTTLLERGNYVFMLSQVELDIVIPKLKFGNEMIMFNCPIFVGLT